MENGYNKLLTKFMKVRWVGFIVIALCGMLIAMIGSSLQSELAPMEDRSQFRLQVTAPEGTSFDYMNNYIDRISGFVLDSIPERESVLSLTSPGSSGVNSGFIRVRMVDPSDRNRSQKEIVEMVNRNINKFNEGRAYAIQEQTISVNRRGGLPVQFVIQNNDFEKIKEVLPQFLDEANKNPVFQSVDADLKFNKPELRVTIDRLKASQLGITVDDISQALQLTLSDLRLGYFTKEGKQYQVMIKVNRDERDDPTDLKGIYVRNAAGVSISLDNLVHFEEATTPPTIYHFNRYKSATISAGLAPGNTIGDGVEAMEKIAQKLLDGTFATSLSGSSRDFQESASNTSFALILALLLIFLILAAQFESFIDPFIIMFTVPLAIAGALLTLWMFGQTINIFSQIGMIMLIGLVTKNGILIVEFANKQRLEGKSKNEAAIYASTMRLRPILMTSLAMALGALPLALSLGDASTSRMPLGIVIVGGIIFSLILTLFVIPAMYSYISTPKKKNPLEEMDEAAAAE